MLKQTSKQLPYSGRVLIDAFRSLYCNTNGRPAHPIRLMRGLLILFLEV